MHALDDGRLTSVQNAPQYALALEMGGQYSDLIQAAMVARGEFIKYANRLSPSTLQLYPNSTPKPNRTACRLAILHSG